MTQIEAVANFIKENGSITSMQAFESLGITRLSARIFEMEQKGYVILKSREEGENRYGEKVRFIRYTLGDEDGSIQG